MTNYQSYDTDYSSTSGPAHTWGGLGGAVDLGVLGGYFVGEMAHKKLTQDAFYNAGNEGLVKGAKNRLLKPRAFDEYASRTYGRYAAGVAKRNMGAATAEAVLEKGAYKSALRKSAIKLGSASALGSALNMVNIYWMAPMLYGAAYHGFKGIQRLGYQLERPNLGSNMTLSTAAFTDRQRGIQAMHNSEFNGRSSMGREAFLYHQ